MLVKSWLYVCSALVDQLSWIKNRIILVTAKRLIFKISLDKVYFHTKINRLEIYTKFKPAVVIGIISILVILFLSTFIGSVPVLNLFGLSQINATVYFLSRLFYWVCLALLILYSIKIEKQNLLLWKEKEYKFFTYLLFIVITYLILFAGGFIIQKLLAHHTNLKSDKISELVIIFRSNKALLVFTALTAGVVEELIFRGYIQTRLQYLFKSPVIAIILSSLFFGLMHYGYGTAINVVVPIFIGLIFAIHYYKYRNIKFLIIFHFLWDLISLFVLLKTQAVL